MRLSGLFKPEYIYRPSNIFRRLFRHQGHQTTETLALAFGTKITCSPAEVIGKSIQQYQIYDLALSELLWRLTTPQDFCIDIGANIGYTTLLLGKRAYQGNVIAFEPHPTLNARLLENIALNASNIGSVQIEQFAISNQIGNLDLYIPKNFQENWGTSSLEKELLEQSQEISVPVITLDQFTAENGITSVDILKIDVEGHENKVVRGAKRLLTSGKIRDIIYEFNDDKGTEVDQQLREFGYKLYSIRKKFTGIELGSTYQSEKSTWEPENKIATLDSGRIENLIGNSGWTIL